jgi:hypothetical protein
MSFASSLLLNWVKQQPAVVGVRSTTCCLATTGRIGHRQLRIAGVRPGGAAQQQQQQQRRYAHSTVRIIVTQDVSDGKLYAGDIANVKAGYARNFLIPMKKAVYATRQNFVKLQIEDPDLETVEQRRLRLEREAEAGDDKDLKAADLLKFYLRNKVVRVISCCVGWIASVVR